jgi:hypothetical protein
LPTPDDLMATAVAQTGLDDFGDGSFREGLEILVRALGEEARLNAAGEGYLYPRLVNHLAQRLQVEDWYRRHPEIDEVPIRAPLFGLGLPRTGSTALSFLLAQDPDIRFLHQWESSDPCPPPSTVRGPDPRVGHTGGGVRPGTRDHVPADENGPMECLDLMALDFRTPIYLAFAQMPSYAAWLLDADLTSTYLYERRALKLLQWGEPERPWRLKSPVHILFLDSLNRAFPDARFVMTHRDPTDVMVSVTDVYVDIAGVFTDHLDRRFFADLNVEHWSVGMDRALKFRDGGADDRFYDIGFRAMQADPIGEVRGLYAWLGEPVTLGFESAMRGWWERNAEEREPAERPTAEAFGLDLEQVRPLFAEYVRRSAKWTTHEIS